MSDLPTKVGPYYWCEKDGDEWEHIFVMDPGNGHLYGHDGVVATSLHDWEQDYGAVGEWLPIPPAEELVELQAKAKMLDEGIEAWAVFGSSGKPQAIDRDPDMCRSKVCHWDQESWNILMKHGYTCEPVTIVRKAKR